MARLSLAFGLLSISLCRGDLTSKYKLNSGYEMPVMGLGVYRMTQGPETVNAVTSALDQGYRMIDTAKIYNNEESVGQAIRDSKVPREDIFLATKLWNDAHGYDAALKAVEESLHKLDTTYLDLYLVHAPQTGKLIETWDAFLEMQRRGIVRSIGVSNYGVAHLQALEEHGRLLPSVNQVEMHPLNWKEREDLIDYCKSRNILLQAYGSVFSGKDAELTNEVVSKVALAHKKSNVQVLLRWGLQMGFQLIPKSIRAERIKQNSEIFDFELAVDEMASISALKGELGAYWQPLSSPVDLGETEKYKYVPQEEL